MSGSGSDHRLALPVGFCFEEFEILKVLGQGGFGITYLARDLNLQSQVAIKEMLPMQFATRVAGYTVIPQRRSDQDAFTWAKSRFLEEARILASLSHGNIVRVLRLMERHGTAYMIMEFVPGKSFSEWIRAHPRPSEQQLKGILLPLLDGLEHIHQRPKKPLLHRDISPDNILIHQDRGPILLDFGSARDILDNAKNLTSMVREGYSPIEQYALNAAQGPYTDLYALAAVMIHAITGKEPPRAADRFTDPNSFQPLSQTHRGKYGENFLSGLDMAFAFDSDERPQSVAEFRKILDGSGLRTKQLAVTRRKPSYRPEEKAVQPIPSKSAGKRKAFIWLATLGVLCMGGGSLGFYYLLKEDGKTADTDDAADHPSSPPPSPKPATPIAVLPVQTPEPMVAVVSPRPTPRANPLSSSSYALPGIGMEFVPMGAPLPGKSVWVCAYQTRRKDYEAFARANSIEPPDPKHRWDQPKFQNVPLNPDPECPVVNVSWIEARVFCNWLKTLDPAIKECRLPTWEEYGGMWGDARFPWGDTWPPSAQAVGNYADKATEARFGKTMHGIPNYADGFETLAPVTQFKPFRKIYGLRSNVKEWCGDHLYLKSQPIAVGASWADGSEWQISRYKDDHDYKMRAGDPEKEEHWPEDSRTEWIGFRCVVELSSE